MSTKIALFGATGAVGQHFLNKALSGGHEVSALVRAPSKLQDHAKLTKVEGDVLNPQDVSRVMQGVDIAVSCLGNVKKVHIMEAAARAILQAAASEKAPPKCIFISSVGCGGTSWVVKQMLQLIGGKSGFMDYERADARIAQERTVPTVLVRPAALKEKPGNGKYRVFQGDGTFARPIAKEDVANFFMDVLADDSWNNNGGIQLAGLK